MNYRQKKKQLKRDIQYLDRIYNTLTSIQASSIDALAIAFNKKKAPKSTSESKRLLLLITKVMQCSMYSTIDGKVYLPENREWVLKHCSKFPHMFVELPNGDVMMESAIDRLAEFMPLYVTFEVDTRG